MCDNSTPGIIPHHLHDTPNLKANNVDCVCHHSRRLYSSTCTCHVLVIVVVVIVVVVIVVVIIVVVSICS